MDDFELPDDLKDSVEVVYLDDDEFIEDGMEEPDPDPEVRETVIDLATLTFLKHSKSVFACALSNGGLLAATGGEDDMAYVWEVATGAVLLECTGHKDSVSEVSFSADDQFVATGDMAGLIQVWSLKDKKLIWCYECDDLEWLGWHHLAPVLTAGTQTGDVYVWQIPQGNCKVLSSTGIACTCGTILPDGKRLLAGYANGQLKLWDMKQATIIWQSSLADGLAITSVKTSADGSLIATAPTGTLLKTIDGKPLAQLLLQGEADVEALTFNAELNVLVTGSLSGQLCVWDVSRQSLRHQARIECAVTQLGWAQTYKLVIGAADGAVYVCDVRTGTLSETLTGHLTEILDLSVAKSGAFVLTSSDDGTAKIFPIQG